VLETIAKGFSAAKNLLKKEEVITEENIANAIKEVRFSLLEADVEFGVVKSFLERVKERVLGLNVKTSVTDKKGRKHKLSVAEHFIGICYQELTALMGPETTDFPLAKPQANIMMVGLQGSGKTTSTGKLAALLKAEKHKPLLVALDIYRPGAVHQLEVLGSKLSVPVFKLDDAPVVEIARQGLKKAAELKCDVVIFDTAGRLSIDEKLMAELSELKALIKPQHILLVLDAMIGQDAVKTAAQFDKMLDLSGFILTKLDGDTRGGAAISIKAVTQKPIKFIGMGEDLKSLEYFRPTGLASRILGMGDVVSLAKDFEEHVDEKEAEEDLKRLMKGTFSFDDFLKQLNMMKKVGSMKSIIERLPGMSDMLPPGANVDDRELIKFESMIQSMTKEERIKPELLAKTQSRRQRVAKGSGRKVADLEQLLSRFMMMRQFMGLVKSNPRALGQMPMMKNLGSMSSMAKSYGSNLGGLDFSMPPQGLFGGDAAPMLMKSKNNLKDKKDKRKQQKQARKKNSKRK
jgi:signal recognition particle subunit SRP54